MLKKAVLAILILTAAAYFGASQRRQSAKVVPTPAPLTKIKVGYSPNIPITALLMAHKKQVFVKHHLEVELVDVRRGAAQALVSDQVDLFIGPVSTFLNAKIEGADILWIAQIENTFLYNLYSYSPKEGLARTKVGVNRIGGEDYFLTLAILDYLGVNPKNISYIQTQDQQGKTTSLLARQIDAGGFFPLGALGIAEKKDSAKLQELLTTGGLNGLKFPNGIIVKKEAFSSKQEAFKAFLEALLEGAKFASENKEEAVEVLAEVLDGNREKAEKLFNLFATSSNHPQKFLPEAKLLDPLIKAVATELPKATNFNSQEFIDTSLVTHLGGE